MVLISCSEDWHYPLVYYSPCWCWDLKLFTQKHLFLQLLLSLQALKLLWILCCCDCGYQKQLLNLHPGNEVLLNEDFALLLHHFTCRTDIPFDFQTNSATIVKCLIPNKQSRCNKLLRSCTSKFFNKYPFYS